MTETLVWMVNIDIYMNLHHDQYLLIQMKMIKSLCVYIYIYIYREREREILFVGKIFKKIHKVKSKWRCPWCNGYRRRKWTW